MPGARNAESGGSVRSPRGARLARRACWRRGTPCLRIGRCRSAPRQLLRGLRQKLADDPPDSCGSRQSFESRRRIGGTRPPGSDAVLPRGSEAVMTFGCVGAAWRDEDAYHFVRELDRAGVAWELLRRNPRYQDDAAASDVVVHDRTGYLEVEAEAGGGPRWGPQLSRRPPG
ncbi:hypothetical protein DdX_21821 [Ditylenchus destructor]|uniref:Transcriptional regulator-like domain-containing protein n=1 Tax=Ditylenchus destructor TaxID=166010 RepID=A0AAD4MIG1_9BILA|nr:hypothetical protein DdX_21821 [Ditylenchus destructor]